MAEFRTPVRRVGVFTSGGDAPGMNAAIRSTVRAAIHRGLEVYGIYHGYQGMLDSDMAPLALGSMANIIQRGGTILKTGRCLEFLKAEFRAQAVQNLRQAGIDAVVCIGGNGSFAGTSLLWHEHQFPSVGLPGTIDNAIWGTDTTIGFDSAVNTAMEAIDRIRDTAASHDRLFIVEVMGRNSGFIAVDVGVAGGAEAIFTPDHNVSVDHAIEHIRQGIARGKMSSILVTAEGQKPGRAYDLAEAIRKKAGFDSKVCILGHIQRGGTPTAKDRIVASRMGAAAIDFLLKGQCDGMVGQQADQMVFVPYTDAIQKEKPLSRELLELASMLST